MVEYGTENGADEGYMHDRARTGLRNEGERRVVVWY